MKRKLLYLIALFQITNINAQTIKLGIESGIGTYQMSGLREYMNELIQENILQPKVVTNFPAYLYFKPSISFCRESMNWGFNFAIMSTGARASIRDYSGEYRYDNKLAGFAPAFFEEFLFYNKEKLSLYLHADIGMLYSSVQLSEYFMVNTQVYTNESIKTISFGFFAQPIIKAIYPINNKLNIEANVGYHFDIYNGPLVQETDPITYFRYAFFQNSLKTQWSGIRFGLGCTYSFN